VFVLGAVGVAGCAAGAYGVWLVASRLELAHHRVFDAIDWGLGAVQDRLPVAQRRVKDAKVTTAEVSEVVRAWAEKKVRDRIVSELEVETRVEKLSGHLQSANLRLDASTEAVLGVRRVLELGQSLGARVDPASMDEVLESLASLRAGVQQAEQAVDEVRRFATPGPGESVEDRLIRVAKVLARILLTLGDVDRRLDHFAVRVAGVRTDAQQSKARTSRYILWGSVVCYGLLVWAAAGQVALCRCGLRRCRRGRSTADSQGTRPLPGSEPRRTPSR
jgi:hypothetical protein